MDQMLNSIIIIILRSSRAAEWCDHTDTSLLSSVAFGKHILGVLPLNTDDC